jgi:hypothetical protein
VTVLNFQIALTNIPISSDPRVTARRIYRSAAGSCSPFQFIATIADNTTTTYTDNTPATAYTEVPDSTTMSLDIGNLPLLRYAVSPSVQCDTIFFGVGAGSAMATNSATPFCGSIFIGGDAGHSDTVGVRNIAIGASALQGSTTGTNNVALGGLAGYGNSTGSRNTFIGDKAGLMSITTGSDNVVIGTQAGPTTNTSSKLFIDVTKRDDPLIGGDFAARTVTISGTLGVVTGGSANTVVCWKTDGKTLGYATVAEITAGTCH